MNGNTKLSNADGTIRFCGYEYCKLLRLKSRATDETMLVHIEGELSMCERVLEHLSDEFAESNTKEERERIASSLSGSSDVFQKIYTADNGKGF